MGGGVTGVCVGWRVGEGELQVESEAGRQSVTVL